MKILGIAGSSSRNSINRRFAKYTCSLLESAKINVLDLNDFEMPIFSIDREKDPGIPEEAKHFRQCIQHADGIVISLAEHNGSYTAAFKNVLDWSSRLGPGLWMDRPMLLLSTSPGKRGAKTVLNAALNTFPRMGARIVASFSLPLFRDHFGENGITDIELAEEFGQAFRIFEDSLNV